MPESTPRRTPASTIPFEYAILPSHAPEIIKRNTISICSAKQILPAAEDERRRRFQALVRRYMNQLLYGCQRDYCDTTTCYTARKRLSLNTNSSRRLTLLSARIIACTLASQDDPLKALCPGKPVVPTLSTTDSGDTKDPAFREGVDEDGGDDEKENRQRGERDKAKSKKRPRESEIVTDKGLKDTKSFTQQLFNTVSVKMIEWIGLPPPTKAFNFGSLASESEDAKSAANSDAVLASPQEPPKFKFPNDPREVMDTGHLTRDSEPATQVRHQEILQQPPRKRGLSFKDVVTPTPHSNAKAKLSSPSGPFIVAPPAVPPSMGHHRHQHHDHHRKSVPPPQRTPSRGDKNTQTLWESPETIIPPQSLKFLDEELCKVLARMCSSPKASLGERRDAKSFAKQSIFYVFSTPQAALSSFGGIGGGELIGFDPDSVNRTLDILLMNGWGTLVINSLWQGLAFIFTKPGKGLSNKDAAGMIVLALHVLANAIDKHEDRFEIVTELRASGKVSPFGNIVMPDIGFEDEMAERLMKRVLRAFAYRWPTTHQSLVELYLIKCFQLGEDRLRRQVAEEFGEDMMRQPISGRLQRGWCIPRCTLEWTRTIFMSNWNGSGILRKESLVGSCIHMFEMLHQSQTMDPVIFQTWAVGERINPNGLPIDWASSAISTSTPSTTHLLDHPYLLSLDYVVTFFRSINLDLMKKAYETAQTNVRLTMQMTRFAGVGYQDLASKIETSLSTYLVVVVRRAHLLEDALNQLIHRESRELVRPLKIRFADGEEGVDQGGVQQEFFVLLMQEILNPDYGVFITDDRTRVSWFWEGTLEGMQKFELVGLIVGLAVYNGVTLPVNFPKALYIKLLGGRLTLDDISDGWPDLHRGLKNLLSWEDGDVGDILMRTYEYSYSVFGKVKSINMLKAPEYLEQPIPKLKRKGRARSSKWRYEKKPTGYRTSLGELSDWLPIVGEERDTWMGSLNDVLLEVMGDEREAEARSRRAAGGERSYTVSFRDLNEVGDEDDTTEASMPLDGFPASLSSSASSQRGQASIEADVAATTEPPFERESTRSETDGTDRSWETVSKDDEIPAASIPLPEDGPDDFSSPPNRPESLYERAERELEEHLDIISSGPSNSRQVSFTGPSDVPPLPDSRSKTPDSDSVYSHQPVTYSTAATQGSCSATEFTDDEEEPSEEEAPLVTNANRHAFVDDYISWLTSRSVHRQFSAFKRGFFAVNNRRTLSLFTPDTLQNLIEGHKAQDIDINKLEAHARYEDGYHANHRVIKDFWAVVRGFSEERKRLLLEFVTSSARLPIGGIENVMFYIVRNGEDSERVPTSLTCFGRLLLPEYSSKKKLREKLKLALANSKGFGTA